MSFAAVLTHTANVNISSRNIKRQSPHVSINNLFLPSERIPTDINPKIIQLARAPNHRSKPGSISRILIPIVNSPRA
jgi:hypothetical protein